MVTIVLTGASFGISYALLGSALRREAAEELRSRLLEFWVLYRRCGDEILNEAGLRTPSTWKGLDYLVRVADAGGTTLLLHVPDLWRGLDRGALARLGPRPGDEPRAPALAGRGAHRRGGRPRARRRAATCRSAATQATS